LPHFRRSLQNFREQAAGKRLRQHKNRWNVGIFRLGVLLTCVPA